MNCPFKIITPETTIHFDDHETLMSFNDDEGNYAFQVWWNLKGSELFSKQ